MWAPYLLFPTLMVSVTGSLSPSDDQSQLSLARRCPLFLPAGLWAQGAQSTQVAAAAYISMEFLLYFLEVYPF